MHPNERYILLNYSDAWPPASMRMELCISPTPTRVEITGFCELWEGALLCARMETTYYQQTISHRIDQVRVSKADTFECVFQTAPQNPFLPGLYTVYFLLDFALQPRLVQYAMIRSKTACRQQYSQVFNMA